MSTPGNFALLKTWIQSARMLMSKNNERCSKWKKMSDFPIIADVVFQNMKREELGLKHTILNSQGPEKKTNLIYTFFMEFFDCTLELLPSHSPMSKMTDLSLRNNAAKWRLSTWLKDHTSFGHNKESFSIMFVAHFFFVFCDEM